LRPLSAVGSMLNQLQGFFYLRKGIMVAQALQYTPDTCDMLPPVYDEIRRTLEKEYSPQQAEALARAMCEIDKGAGEVTVHELLAAHFTPDQAEKLTRILFMVAGGLKGDEQSG